MVCGRNSADKGLKGGDACLLKRFVLTAVGDMNQVAIVVIAQAYHKVGGSPSRLGNNE